MMNYQKMQPSVAIISDELTPYRLHVLKRVVAENPELKLTSFFTHTTTSMPWGVDPSDEINSVSFPNLSLSGRSAIGIHSIRLYRAIRDKLITDKTRLIVLLGYNNLTRFLLIRWAHKRGVPLLLAGDSNIFGDAWRSFIFKFIKGLYLKYVIRRIAGLMPMGSCGRAFFLSYCNHDKPTFLFPYEPDYKSLVELGEIGRGEFLNSHGLSEGRKRLLYSGRLVTVKRVDILLRAFEKIAPFRPDWDLVIAGDGPLRGSLEQQLPFHLRERVRWLGFLRFAEMAACYKACDALVIPSEREPWALVVNEAVAAGLPVVASDVVGSAVELVRHRVNGLLVPPGNIDAWVAALLLVTDPVENKKYCQRSSDILADWRAAADPICGLRDALRYFNVVLY